MKDWIGVLHLVSRVLEVAPLLPFICIWLRQPNIPYKLNLVTYYIGSKVFFYILDVLSRIVFQNNVFIFHISTVVSVFILALTYNRIFYSVKLRKYISISLMILLLIAFFDAVFISGLFVDVNAYSQAFGSAFLVSLALMHVVQISRTSLYLESQPEFFFSIAVLAYFSYTIATYVASNIIYHSGYSVADIIKMDKIISSPDAFLFVVQMGLFAWMFSFFPLNITPLRALPYWLHYSRWHPRSYRLLGQNVVSLRHLTTTAGN